MASKLTIIVTAIFFSADVVAAEFPARKTGKIIILTSQVSWVRKAKESRVVPINIIFCGFLKYAFNLTTTDAPKMGSCMSFSEASDRCSPSPARVTLVMLVWARRSVSRCWRSHPSQPLFFYN